MARIKLLTDDGLRRLVQLINTKFTDKLNRADIVNDLTTGGTDKALSAEQGKVLFQNVVNGKQAIATAINDIAGKNVANSLMTHNDLAVKIKQNGGSKFSGDVIYDSGYINPKFPFRGVYFYNQRNEVLRGDSKTLHYEADHLYYYSNYTTDSALIYLPHIDHKIYSGILVAGYPIGDTKNSAYTFVVAYPSRVTQNNRYPKRASDTGTSSYDEIAGTTAPQFTSKGYVFEINDRPPSGNVYYSLTMAAGTRIKAIYLLKR